MDLREQYVKIGEFMEYVYIPHTDDKLNDAGWYIQKTDKKYKHVSSNYICRNTKNLNFRYDWNNLIRVVLKIESLTHQKFGKFHVIIQDDSCTIQATNRTKESTYNKRYCSPTKLKSVYESVLLFIDWYNTVK